MDWKTLGLVLSACWMLEEGAAAQVTVDAAAQTSIAAASGAMRTAIDRNREERTKKELGALRAALSIFYGDKEGVYPASPLELVPDYLRAIPAAVLPGTGHAPNAAIVVVMDDIQDYAGFERAIKETGGWLYVGNPNSPMFGTIHVDSRRTDSKGVPWWKY